MSIREEVKAEIATIIRYADTSENPVLIPDRLKEDYLRAAETILSIPALKVVDLEARLPRLPAEVSSHYADQAKGYREGYIDALCDIGEDGWFKEAQE